MANIDGVNPPVLNDTDYVEKIQTSFEAIDDHDHTAGKGVPLSGGSIADGSVTEAKLAVVLANANKFLTRDVTGAVESATKAVPTGAVVGTTDSQTLTNKVLTGNTIANFENSGTVTVPTGAGTLVTLAASQTLTNKTLTSPLMTNPEITAGGLTVPEISTPTTPASGKGIYYFKADGFPYAKNNAGVEILLSGSGSGGDSSSTISNLGLAASVAANALTVAVKDKNGTDPSGGSVVSVGFRDSTITVGEYSMVNVSSALSMTVSSGSTLGHASGVDMYIYVYLINNAGTAELAVSTSVFEDGIHSTTAEGGAGAADSNAVMYSTTARTNVATRLVGRLLVNEATAGTWATAPSEIDLQPFTSDKPYANYSASNNNISSGGAIAFNTFVEDNRNAFDAPNGVYTATESGLYRLTVSFLTTGTFTSTAGNKATLYLDKNAGTELVIDEMIYQATATLPVSLKGSGVVRLSTGDTVVPRISNTFGGTLVGDNQDKNCWVVIEKID